MWSLGFGKINLEHMYLHQGQRVSSSHRALARYPLRSYTEVGGMINKQTIKSPATLDTHLFSKTELHENPPMHTQETIEVLLEQFY